VKPAQNKIRSQLALAARYHPDDVETATRLRRELKASLAEDYVYELISDDVPLTIEQRMRLASLLTSEAA